MKRLIILISILFFFGMGASFAGINDGLVTYYPLNGNANDESGNGNDGIVSGGMTYSDGVIDQAASFDGASYIRDINGNPLGNVSDSSFAISSWINFTSYGASDHAVYFTLGNDIIGSNSNEEQVAMLVYPGNLLGTGITDTYNEYFGKVIKYNTPINAGEWIHTVTIISNANLSFYVNGQLIDIQPVTFDFTSPGWQNSMMLGATHYDDSYRNPFVGLLDEVRIYDRALSEAEIQELYQLGTNQPPMLDPIGNKNGQEGRLLEFQISAIDPDTNDILTFSADNLPEGATFDPEAATFSWTPGYDQAGVYENIEFIVSDDNADPGVDNELITITVGNVNRPPEFDPVDAKTVNENETLQFAVTASDPDGDTLELFTGELPTGASFDPVTGIFWWTPDNTQAGNYVVGFYALDNSEPPMEGELEVAISVGDVPTPIEAIKQLIKDVRGMDIKKCQKIRYIVKLKLTKRFINRGRVWLACFSLNHFIDMVEFDMNHDRISQEDGQKLIDGANYILTQLQ